VNNREETLATTDGPHTPRSLPSPLSAIEDAVGQSPGGVGGGGAVSPFNRGAWRCALIFAVISALDGLAQAGRCWACEGVGVEDPYPVCGGFQLWQSTQRTWGDHCGSEGGCLWLLVARRRKLRRCVAAGGAARWECSVTPDEVAKRSLVACGVGYFAVMRSVREALAYWQQPPCTGVACSARHGPSGVVARLSAADLGCFGASLARGVLPGSGLIWQLCSRLRR
jgi:hypothetical protein